MPCLNIISLAAIQGKIGTDRLDKDQLLNLKKEVDEVTNYAIDSLVEMNLKDKTEIINPVAKTKYDALTFTFKHQMWHNGQIAMIKRIIGEKAIK